MGFDETKMIVSKLPSENPPPPKITQTPETQTTAVVIILFGSAGLGYLVRSLPYEKVDGNLVPTILFKGHPWLFHGFVISIILSFIGSFLALLTRNKSSRFARFNTCYSTLSFAVALSILLLCTLCH